MRGATLALMDSGDQTDISIHAPHAGRDGDTKAAFAPSHEFQSTRPMRGATASTRGRIRRPTYFNPRAPCGARLSPSQRMRASRVFQSTRPMRGATSSVSQRTICRRYFNPRAPCGARRASLRHLRAYCHFNPRAPCGARQGDKSLTVDVDIFQSTRPMRGATPTRFRAYTSGDISIHAPHAGRDRRRSTGVPSRRNFNPRAPCGARLTVAELKEYASEFQSTRPMRGATFTFPPRWSESRFQSTRPMRGATRQGRSRPHTTDISIHAPHAGRDYGARLWPGSRRNFNPRAPCGARQQKYTKLLYTLLRQKAILRQFHAKRCLSKRFAACRSAKTSLFAVRTAAEISASFCFAL